MHAAQAMNLAQLLSQTARRHPHRAAVIHGDRQWTWRELDQRVDALVAALRALGLQQGERILVQSRNNLQLFESCWAAFRLGCVWVPVNHRLTPPEIAVLSATCHPRAMIHEARFSPHADAACAASAQLEHLICIDPSGLDPLSYEALVSLYLGAEPASACVMHDDPLWLFFTSGTTGRPKAAVLTHGQMNFVVTNHLADLIPGTTHEDCSVAVAPLSHGAGIHALLNVARGAATVLPEGERLDPAEVWRLVERHRVSNLFAVPTIVKLLVEHPAVDQHDHRSLRYLVYAGAPMYRADQKRALAKLGPVLVQYFGLGEVTGCITVLPTWMHSLSDDDVDAPVGSCGYPRTGMEVAILDEQLQPVAPGTVGEICCRGPAVLAEYHDNPDATAKALRGGWFHTGDLGRLDERGLLYITGRESDMYISGGANVYPREVEEVLLAHPDILEVAVLGVPDDTWGEVGVAIIVRRKAAAISRNDILAQLEGRCARYRWPRHIVFWESMPRSGYGKVVKKDLRHLLVERGELPA